MIMRLGIASSEKKKKMKLTPADETGQQGYGVEATRLLKSASWQQGAIKQLLCKLLFCRKIIPEVLSVPRANIMLASILSIGFQCVIWAGYKMLERERERGREKERERRERERERETREREIEKGRGERERKFCFVFVCFFLLLLRKSPSPVSNPQ